MELAKKKAIKTPSPVVLSWTTVIAGNEWFLLPWKCPFEKDLPGVGGRGAFTIQVFSGTWGDGPASHACLELLQTSAVGRSAHFYMKRNRTASVDVSVQPGIFPGLKCYLGRCVSA